MAWKGVTKMKKEEKNGLSNELQEKILKLDKEYPLAIHTNAGRLFSAVRRMTAEKELDIPINLRTGFAVSVKLGKSANQMSKEEWEEFYSTLSGELNSKYPELYEQISGKK